jgi:hypothetical protein
VYCSEFGRQAFLYLRRNIRKSEDLKKDVVSVGVDYISKDCNSDGKVPYCVLVVLRERIVLHSSTNIVICCICIKSLSI